MPLDPQLQTLVDGMAANPDQKPIHELSPDQAREGYRALGALFGPGEPVASVEALEIPGPEGPIGARLYRPEGPGPHPLLVFYHGGGWVIGDLETHDRECRALCNRGRVAVLSVDYRLAPEHRFPTAAEDAYAALVWAHENAAPLGLDPGRLSVGGDSAGGNLAAVCALLARERQGPPLRHQLLVYPATDLRPGDLYPSRRENAAGPFLEQSTMDWFVAHYLGEVGAEVEDLRASPLLADSHAGLPAALVVTAEFDPLRDEGAAYAERLGRSGVAARHSPYPGMAHLFFQLSALVEASRRLLDECGAALREAHGG